MPGIRQIIRRIGRGGFFATVLSLVWIVPLAAFGASVSPAAQKTPGAKSAPRETTARCGNFSYTLPPDYVAKYGTARSSITILLNPPFKKTQKDDMECRIYCVDDEVTPPFGSSGLHGRDSFYFRDSHKHDTNLKLLASERLANGKDFIHLFDQITQFPTDEENYLEVLLPVIEIADETRGRPWYLVIVEKRLWGLYDKKLPRESKEEKKRRMRETAEEVYASIRYEAVK